MFGNDDSQAATTDQQQADPATASAPNAPAADSSLGVDDAAMASQVNDIVGSTADSASTAPLSSGYVDAPAATVSDPPTADALPALDQTAPAITIPAPVVTSTATTDDLLSIKQQALQQLSPLVDHLDQTPEEKFRTTMMMIQAADNQDLIQAAYAAAQSISDEKTRAQALLDIVNEINYFTQQKQ